MELIFCTQCRRNKLLESFYKQRNGSPLHICKECRQARSRRVYLNRAEYYKAQSADNHLKNRERTLKIHSDWRKRNREKCRAQWQVWKAVRSGALVRSKYCEQCGAATQIQAHHFDYRQPLNVEWLCSGCHGERHRTLREAARG
jgi:hypothetical protein